MNQSQSTDLPQSLNIKVHKLHYARNITQNKRHRILCICYFSSYDLVKVFVGRRLVKRLTKGGGQEDNLYFKDDDGDDDDDDDDDDDECDDDDDDDRKDVDFAKGMFFAEQKQQEPRIVSIHGTGEVVRVVFKSDPWVTRRGFFAHYSMGQGEYSS